MSSSIDRINPTRSTRQSCTCRACQALRDECGELVFEFYRTKLLQRGWAGRVTPVERAYQRAHAPWMQVAVEQGRRLAQAGRLPRITPPSVQGVSAQQSALQRSSLTADGRAA